MIHALLGMVEEKKENFFVLRVGGIFFKIFGGRRTIDGLRSGKEVKIFCSVQVKEREKWEIYGFSGEEELRTFEILDGVTGVGPRTALATVEALGVKGVAAAIVSGEADFLAKAPGVSKRAAERMVLELQGKFAILDSGELSDLMRIDVEIEETLIGLGYKREAIREILRGFGKTPKKMEERLKAALKEISRKQ